MFSIWFIIFQLSPEALHTSAAVLCKILVFMIDNGTEIFLVPDTLATDVKAYWAKKERKLKSPVKDVSTFKEFRNYYFPHDNYLIMILS